jgi:hypothetical protein
VDEPLCMSILFLDVFFFSSSIYACTVMTSWEIWCKAYFLSWMDNSDKSSHSFGTGFEMMQTGYYSQGVWDILNGGIK